MSEERQEQFEGLELDGYSITLNKAQIAGIGKLKYGDKVRLEGTAIVTGIAFGREKKTGAFIRGHILTAEAGEIVALEVLTDESLFNMSR